MLTNTVNQASDIYDQLNDQLVECELSALDGAGVQLQPFVDSQHYSNVNLVSLEQIKEEPISEEDSRMLHIVKGYQ